MRKFDRQFGKLTRRLQEDINLIIYSDHGMAFGEGYTLHSQIMSVVNEAFEIFSYPALYLADNADISEIAGRLVHDTDIDFTFYRVSQHKIMGIHQKGIIYFQMDQNTVQYTYRGSDILGYYENGYSGEFLSDEEWLKRTHALEYPAVPVHLKHYFNDGRSGDILTLMEEGKFYQTPYSKKGNHGGITKSEMTSPLLAKGPDVTNLQNRTYFWLPNLFHEVSGLNFNSKPSRERHTFMARYDITNAKRVTEFTLSPRYRLNFGVSAYGMQGYEFNQYDVINVWGKVDIFRSYLSRLWVGAGAGFYPDETTPVFLARYDIHIQKFVFRNLFATNRPYSFKISYEATPWLAIEIENLTSFGFRFDF